MKQFKTFEYISLASFVLMIAISYFKPCIPFNSEQIKQFNNYIGIEKQNNPHLNSKKYNDIMSKREELMPIYVESDRAYIQEHLKIYQSAMMTHNTLYNFISALFLFSLLAMFIQGFKYDEQ